MLKTRDPKKIGQMIIRLKKEAEKIIKELVEISWFMRGGLQLLDAYDLTHQEREAIKEFVKSNLEAQKESTHPQF